MPIITISRSSYTYGKKVAEAVAETLGYTCISREEVLNASQEFNMPGIKLVRELPLILDQTVFNKHRYISYIRSPDKNWSYLDENIGIETICFIVSLSRRTDIERLFSQLAEKNKTLVQRSPVSINSSVVIAKKG